MDETAGVGDRAGISDQATAAAAREITDQTGIKGTLVIERFTPPAEHVRREIAKALPRDVVLERLVELRVMSRRGNAPRFRRRARLAHALQWAPEYLAETLETSNLVTQVGDQYYGERAAGIGGAPAQVTVMKLGTGSTAPSKTGAGAAVVTYAAGTNKAIDGGFPTSALSVASRRIQWKTSWAAGEADGFALREVVIVNDPNADAASLAANTISRALFGPMTLGATDTLSITWNHDILGA